MAIKRQLTFVVGAGASHELGLPVGRGLLEDISKLATRRLSNIDPQNYRNRVYHELADEELSGAVQKLIPKYNDLFTITSVEKWHKEAFWISRNCPLAPSIDNLIHTHRDNERLVDLGKILICYALKQAEKNSCLMRTNSDPDDISFISEKRAVRGQTLSGPSSWLGHLFWLLAEGNNLNDFLEALSKVSFISFNYDRCIQQFLTHAAKSYFRLSDDIAIKSVYNAIQIAFPYGSLGELQITSSGAEGFGNFDVWGASKQIRTFTEGLEDVRTQAQIKKYVSNCDELIFLGFGFIDLNLKALFENSQKNGMGRVSGTAFGFSAANIDSVNSKIIRLVNSTRDTNLVTLYPDLISLEDLGCSEFFAANSIRLRS